MRYGCLHPAAMLHSRRATRVLLPFGSVDRARKLLGRRTFLSLGLKMVTKTSGRKNSVDAQRPKGRAVGIPKKRGRPRKSAATPEEQAAKATEAKATKAIAKAKGKAYEEAKLKGEAKDAEKKALGKAKKNPKSHGGDEMWDDAEEIHDEKNRLRQVVFTVNNWDGTELPALYAWHESGKIRYFSVGREKGKKKGVPHLQGFIQFTDKVKFAEIKAILPRAWIKRAWGTVEHNKKYTQKEGDFDEHGFPTRQGADTDWHEIHEMIKSGASLKQVVDAYPTHHLRFSRGIQAHVDVYKVRDNRAKHSLREQCERLRIAPILFQEGKVVVLEGPARIGKTQYALSHFENPLLVRRPDMLREFDPDKYDGIVFDDFNPAQHGLSRDDQIALTEYDTDTSVGCRHNDGYIPAGTPKIFTCNPGHFPFTHDDSGAITGKYGRVRHMVLTITRDEIEDRLAHEWQEENCQEQAVTIQSYVRGWLVRKEKRILGDQFTKYNLVNGRIVCKWLDPVNQPTVVPYRSKKVKRDDEILDFETSLEFSPSRSFYGRFKGWAFKCGQYGLGYYRDDKSPEMLSF